MIMKMYRLNEYGHISNNTILIAKVIMYIQTTMEKTSNE